MARPAFYRFFSGDYLRDASHLSLLEHGAYRRLIDLYMDAGGPLPFDLPRLYRLLHATSKEEQVAVQTVITEFFKIEGTLIRLKRCDREIEWQLQTSASASAAGKRSAMVRAAKVEYLTNQALANARSTSVEQPFNDRSTSQSQSQSHIKEKKDPTDLSDAEASDALTLTPPEGKPKPPPLPCPLQRIAALWNEAAPLCKPASTDPDLMTAREKNNMRNRWRWTGVTTTEDGLAWFRSFFASANKSEFLTARAPPRDGQRPFQASLHWLMSEKAFMKHYRNEYD